MANLRNTDTVARTIPGDGTYPGVEAEPGETVSFGPTPWPDDVAVPIGFELTDAAPVAEPSEPEEA